MTGKAKVPYSTKSSWLRVQQACPNLVQVHKYLTSGASVPKRKRKLTDIRRYLSCGVTVLSGQLEGLLVIKQSTPFKPVSHRVVIPRRVSDGLLTALHITLNHPSANQLKHIFARSFFCLDMDILAKKVTDHCYTCTSLGNIPSTFHQQTTSVPGNIIGCKYSADVARRFSQFILLIREDITSYTDGTLISNEKADSLRNGLLLLMSRLRSQHGPRATIRTDPATSLRTLLNDRSLDKYNVQVELGEPKNVNKNPIAESAIRELHSELLRLQPHGGKISETTLAQAIGNINSLVRHHKLSATEAWTKRDKLTGDPLNIEDAELIKLKYSQRCNNHEASAKHKARGKIASPFPNINVGQLVYLYSDGSKLQSREKYLVTAVDDDTVLVQKFTKDQFRNRQYRVKRSDLIILPVDYSNKPTTQFDDLFTEAYEKTLPVKPTLSQQSTNVGNPIQPLYHHPTQWLTSDEDSDDDDDEYDDCVSKYFLPNHPPTEAEIPIDN